MFNRTAYNKTIFNRPAYIVYNIAETLTISDSIASNGINNVSESFALSEGVAFHIAFSEAFQTIDLIISNGSLLLEEEIGIIDSITSIIINISEVLSVLDTFFNSGQKNVSITLGVVDTYTNNIIWFRTSKGSDTYTGNSKSDSEWIRTNKGESEWN